MIVPIVIASVVGGAVLMGARSPKTRVVKTNVIGPRTGITYRAEEFPETGFLVVYAPDAIATFMRKRGGGFMFVRGRGHPTSLEIMRSDISPATSASEASPARGGEKK